MPACQTDTNHHLNIYAVQILVFKTDICDPLRAKAVLDAEPAIHRWTVDTEDIDRVLRIEGTGVASERVIELLSTAGFFCDELPD